MVTEYSWLAPMMTKGFLDGIVLGFKMIWMVIKDMPWQMSLLIVLMIINDLMGSGHKRKRKAW